jgi:preprotein translocase subunit YajC
MNVLDALIVLIVYIGMLSIVFTFILEDMEKKINRKLDKLLKLLKKGEGR